MRFDSFDYEDEFQDEFDRLFEDFTRKQWHLQNPIRCENCDEYMDEGLCENCDSFDDFRYTYELMMDEDDFEEEV